MGGEDERTEKAIDELVLQKGQRGAMAYLLGRLNSEQEEKNDIRLALRIGAMDLTSDRLAAEYDRRKIQFREEQEDG